MRSQAADHARSGSPGERAAAPLHFPPGSRHRRTTETLRLTRHVERHFTSGDTVRDIVIGMSDGQIAAGSIAMGLGGYFAARSDAEHYDSERRREQAEIREIPAADTRGERPC